MAIDDLPLFGTAPLLGQSQEVFDANASDTLGKMENFVTKTNISIGQINDTKDDIDSIKTDVYNLLQQPQSANDYGYITNGVVSNINYGSI